MGSDWTDSGASTGEHENRQGTGAIWRHKWPYKWPYKGCIEQEGEVPEQWDKCSTILLSKGKADVLMVDKHKVVRLLEH